MHSMRHPPIADGQIFRQLVVWFASQQCKATEREVNGVACLIG